MHSYDGRFDDNILVVGRIGCEKILQKINFLIMSKVFFGY